MGLTLPVIIEDPLLRETEFGRAIGFLYGSNTLGAMLGAILGEAYLIGAFGLYGTSLAAAADGLHCCGDCLGSREIWSGAIRRRFQSALTRPRAPNFRSASMRVIGRRGVCFSSASARV